MNKLTRILLKRLANAARPYLKSTGLLQVSGVYNRSAMAWVPGAQRVLVLAPHMDDETIGCGGTLALHAQRGAEITVVFLTDGRNGAPGLALLSEAERERRQRELVAERKREARCALDALGVQRMICLDAEDGALRADVALAGRLRPIIEQVRPELVYLPFYLEEHEDHRAASDILLAAAQGMDTVQCMGYEVWTPLFPNCLVRIDAALARKKAALHEYRSQLIQSDYVHASLGLNAYRSIGLLDGHGAHAEAFHSCSLADYRAAYRLYTGK